MCWRWQILPDGDQKATVKGLAREANGQVFPLLFHQIMVPTSLDKWSAENKVTWIYHTPCYPWGAGLAERTNALLKEQL